MSAVPPAVDLEEIDYPDSDGKPLADNSRQLEWISTLYGNIASMFRERDDVFVKGNQLWYPVKGHPEICVAPDVYAVFGRPKGYRGSWKQWEEDDVPMTVVFEVRSPMNTDEEMADKQAFYNDYGVEEYYLYDPDENTLQAFLRHGEALLRVREVDGWRSPRLDIVFDLSGPEMIVRYPDGAAFLSFEDQKAAEEAASQRADDEKKRADDEKRRADDEKRRAEDEKSRADDAARQLARLKLLTRKVAANQATDEERAELDRLLGDEDPTE